MFYVLIVIAAASRFLPHPPNVACVGALGLLAGCYLSGRRAWLVPLGVLLVSDVIGHVFAVPGMGFYSPVAMLMVYAGAMSAIPVGRWMRRHRSVVRIPAGALAASSLFFLISNFGVWLAGWYTLSLGGLIACYTNAIPFFGYTIAGDLFFTIVLFSAYEFSRQPQHRGQLVPETVSR